MDFELTGNYLKSKTGTKKIGHDEKEPRSKTLESAYWDGHRVINVTQAFLASFSC